MKKILFTLSAMAAIITVNLSGEIICCNKCIKKTLMQDYTILQKSSMLIMGIECRTSNDPSAGPVQISQHWQKFYQENIFDRIPNRVSNEVIALYCDYEGDYTQPYSLVIGCQVSSAEEIPEGMVAKTIPATSYAVFNAAGEFPKSLVDTWVKIWKTDLKRTYSGDFEVYGEKFSSQSRDIEVFIAIE